MNVKTFIDRPILSGIISTMILLVGVVCFWQLPVEQFPPIAPPAINMNCNYTGANAETVLKSVIAPLEEAINGVEHMTYMISSATNTGKANIDIYFKQGTNPSMAHVDVQNRISQAQTKLPADVKQSGVTVRRRQPSNLKQVAMYSPDDRYDSEFINNYMRINIEPRLNRVEGVGEVNVHGPEYAMRLWLNPDKMATYKLMPSDIREVLDEQNIEAAAGTLGEDSESTFQYTLKYRGRYERPEDYAKMVIKALPEGQVLRIGDVADVELGSLKYTLQTQVNGHPGTHCSISQTPGSNANATIERIDKVLEKCRAELPDGLVLIDLQSSKDFVDASIHEVLITLVLAILLVVLIIFVFLQDIRATLIPTITILVSLIGTFVFMYLAGYSINTLTLFALVLVIGTVVDDAIVVVEAVKARMDSGETSPYRATIQAMSGLSVTLFTTTLVFMAVFVPVCFLGGTSGVFYRQFGVTMAVAVGLSLINALTLSPMLCSLLMKSQSADGDETLSEKHTEHHGVTWHMSRMFNYTFTRLQRSYGRGVEYCLQHKGIALACTVVAALAFSWLLTHTKSGLVPSEDMGTLTVSIQAAPGSTMAETRRIVDEVDSCIRDMEEIKAYSIILGAGRNSGQGASNAQFTIRLKNWDERPGKEHSMEAVQRRIYALTSNIKEAKIMIQGEPVIAGYGSSNGFDLYVQDKIGNSWEELNQYTRDLIQGLNERPEIARAQTSYAMDYPQYRFDIDVVRCKRMEVDPNDVLNVISAYVGGNYVSDFNRFSKLYRVMVQSYPETRIDRESLYHMYVRSKSGHMMDVYQFVDMRKEYGSESLTRFNMFNAIRVNGVPNEGYSSGDCIRAIREVAARTLPEGYTYEFSGMTREENEQSGGSTVWVFLACTIFIYLILCGLYESICIPLAVIFSVPFGLAGSFLFARIFGIENNIYMQTGIIMLIGLLSKTAILLTEYASLRRESGMSIEEAALDAAHARLRPILMTSLTMVFGLLPMCFATGAGANGDRSLGVGTVGGMLIGTAALLFVVPVLFVLMQRLQEKMPKPRLQSWLLMPLALSALLTHSGCALYGDYQRPDDMQQLANELTGGAASDEEASALSTDSVSDAHWREIFVDAALQQLIDTALERNADLGKARLRVEQAQATLSAHRLAYLPSLSLEADAKTNAQQGHRPSHLYAIGPTANWELDLAGARTNARRSALAQLAYREAQCRLTRTEVIATVASHYYMLLLLDRQCDIDQETLLNWQRNARMLRSLKEVGLSTEVAVLQGEAACLALHQTLLSVQQEREDTEMSLCTLLGWTPRHIERSKLSTQPLHVAAMQGIALQQLASRPDVLMAEAELRQCFYAVNEARAAFYPRVTLSGSAMWQFEGIGSVTQPGDLLFTALAQLVQPLFAQGKNRANLRIAKAQQEEALLNFRQALLQAGQSVLSAIAHCQLAEKHVQDDLQRVNLLSSATDKTILLMQHSSTTYLEILSAQQNLLSAEQTLAQHQYEALAAMVKLFEETH